MNIKPSSCFTRGVGLLALVLASVAIAHADCQQCNGEVGSVCNPGGPGGPNGSMPEDVIVDDAPTVVVTEGNK